MFKINPIWFNGDAKMLAGLFIKGATLEELGSGTFASAHISKDGKRIYKVITKYDSAYMAFLNMLSNQTEQNPLFPIIYSVTNINAGECVIVAMEELAELPEWSPLIEFDFEQQIRQILITALMEPYNIPKTPDCLEQAAMLIREVHDSKVGMFLDVHQGNIMMRGMQPVLTDVLACSTDF